MVSLRATYSQADGGDGREQRVQAKQRAARRERRRARLDLLDRRFAAAPATSLQLREVDTANTIFPPNVHLSSSRRFRNWLLCNGIDKYR